MNLGDTQTGIQITISEGMMLIWTHMQQQVVLANGRVRLPATAGVGAISWRGKEKRLPIIKKVTVEEGLVDFVG